MSAGPPFGQDHQWCLLISSTTKGLASVPVAGTYAAHVAVAQDEVGLTATVCGQ
jgi:hypothetical protein